MVLKFLNLTWNSGEFSYIRGVFFNVLLDTLSFWPGNIKVYYLKTSIYTYLFISHSSDNITSFSPTSWWMNSFCPLSETCKDDHSWRLFIVGAFPQDFSLPLALSLPIYGKWKISYLSATSRKLFRYMFYFYWIWEPISHHCGLMPLNYVYQVLSNKKGWYYIYWNMVLIEYVLELTQEIIYQ